MREILYLRIDRLDTRIGEMLPIAAELSVSLGSKHYTQAMPESKRAAQARVLNLIFGENSANSTFTHMAVSPTIN